MRLSGPTDEELISNAAGVINPEVVGDRLFGDVGRAPTTRDGNLYLPGKDKVSKLEDLLPSRECPEPLAWLSRGRCR